MCSYRIKLRRCTEELIARVTTTSPPFVVGQMAHNIQKKDENKDKNALRIDEGLGKNIDSYDNLILLCPTHHIYVDKNRHIYTTSKIKQMKKDHENWVDKIRKKDYNAIIQNRIKFYNLFLYACTIYLAIGLLLMFRAKEEGLFILAYTSLCLLIPKFVYCFDEKTLLQRLDMYQRPDTRKFRRRIIFLSFLLLCFFPIFLVILFYDISINQNEFVIYALLGFPCLIVFLLLVFKITKEENYLIGKFETKLI